MHASFDRDCCQADKIYIIGYSFSDEHINECIKTALRYNPKVNLEIVDPNFFKEDLELKLISTIFQYSNKLNLSNTKISENQYTYLDNQVAVYTLKFKEYLLQKSNS